jgi:hypothetical protein
LLGRLRRALRARGRVHRHERADGKKDVTHEAPHGTTASARYTRRATMKTRTAFASTRTVVRCPCA